MRASGSTDIFSPKQPISEEFTRSSAKQDIESKGQLINQQLKEAASLAKIQDKNLFLEGIQEGLQSALELKNLASTISDKKKRKYT